MWALAAQGQDLIQSTLSDDDNGRFSKSEQQDIHNKLTDLEQLLLQQKTFLDREVILIQNEFKYLREGSERLGKKDWKGIVIGQLINLLMILALPPSQANQIMHAATALFVVISNKLIGN